MKRIIGIASFLALMTSIACVLDWPQECDPANAQPCDDERLVCEVPYPDEDPHFGWCVSGDGGDCGGGAFPCDGGICHPDSDRCDGFPDCWDGNDEKGCPGCAGFACDSPPVDQCVPAFQRCDGFDDCGVTSADEINCPGA